MEETTTTAVAEPQGPMTKDVLAQQLAARQSQVQAAQQRQRALEGLALARGLTLLEVQEQLGLDRWIELEQVHLDRLASEMQRAQIAFDLQGAVAHHDSFIGEKQQCYQGIAEAIGGLYDAFQHLADVDRAQKEPLRALVSPAGQPFAPIGADELIQNVLSRMPEALAWNGVVFGQKLTKGDLESMMDVDSGGVPVVLEQKPTILWKRLYLLASLEDSPGLDGA